MKRINSTPFSMTIYGNYRILSADNSSKFKAITSAVWQDTREGKKLNN